MEFQFARRNVVCFSTADWDTPLPTNKHQLMKRIAARGGRVLYIETLGTRAPKLSSGMDIGRIGRRLARSFEGARKREKRLYSISPAVRPDWSSPAKIAVNRMAFHLQCGSALAKFPDPIVWVYSPYAAHLLPLFPDAPVVYHMVDDLSAVPGADRHALREAEMRLFLRADVVFCTEKSLYDRALPHAKNCHLMPNVADYKHFSNPDQLLHDPRLAALRALPRPRLVFSGNLAEHKVDLELIARLATARPDWQVVLIGPEWEGNRDAGPIKRLRRLKNVMMTGHVEYQNLPPFLHEADILLIPYLLNDATRAVSPLKLFEYLGTGKPVVSSPLPSVLPWSGAISVASNLEEWIACLDKTLADPHQGIKQRRALARRHTWERRLDEMEARIGEGLATSNQPWAGIL